MPKLFTFASLLVCFALSTPVLSAQDRIVIFGGYSYLRAPVTAAGICTNCLAPNGFITVTNTQNLNGWELSGTYRFLRVLGIGADFSAHYGPAANGSSRVHQYTGGAGPELSFPARVSPFAHVLFGGTHQTITAGTLNNSGAIFIAQPNTVHSFATVLGGGIDLKLIPHVWLRPIQIDYLLTHLYSTTQNQLRISAGLVLHF